MIGGSALIGRLMGRNLANNNENIFKKYNMDYIFILVVFFVGGIIYIKKDIKKEVKKDIKGKTDEELEELVRAYIISKIKQPQMGVDKKTVVDLPIYNIDYSKEEIISNRWRIKDEKLLDYCSGIDLENVEYVDIFPKTKKQVYLLPKGVSLRMRDKRVIVEEEYDEITNTIKVSSKKSGINEGDSNIFEVSVEEIFETFDIKEEMETIDYYINKFDNYEKNEEFLSLQNDEEDINKWFEYFIDVNKYNYKSSQEAFVLKIKNQKKIENEDEIIKIYEFFEIKVKPFIQDMCMCVIAMHEYDNPKYLINRSARYDNKELYKILKVRLPWINVESANKYFKYIKSEKQACIKYLEIHRAKVWIEAYEEYLHRTGKYSIGEMNRLTDDEISQLYFKYIEEKGIRKEANEWVDRYCRQYK